MEIKANIKTKAKKTKLKKTRLYISLIIVLIIIIGMSLWGVSTYNAYYNNVTLLGHWVSQETGKTVEFLSNGKVKVDDTEMGEYMISSPGLMTYNLEGYTFEMHYKVKGRSLVWGILGEEEKFDRKGF